MKQIISSGWIIGLLIFCLTGCGGQRGIGSEDSAGPALDGSEEQEQASPPSSVPDEKAISREAAFAIAVDNAGVPESDVYNIKSETDENSGIPVYDIEFETDYGDYDFEVAVNGGQIVGADYEVDEEWLNTLESSPVSLEEAAAVVSGKVPGSSAEDIEIREERDDGRSWYEGELFFDGMKYEFELDPQTGMIYDWNADLRN